MKGQRTIGLRAAAPFAAAIILASCAAYESAGASDRSWDDDGNTDAGTQEPSDRSPGSGVEVESFDLTTPTASLNYVWIANTTRGTLAKVAVTDGAIRIDTVRVGAEPTDIVTDPNADVAVVLNRGSDTISVVRAGAAGEDDDVETIDVVARANRLSLSPNADVLFAWYDNRRAELGDSPGSLTEVSAVRLLDDGATAVQLSVGVNIRDIVYSADGSEVFILTDDGVSRTRVEALTEDRFVPPVRIAEAGEDIPIGEDREIVIADDDELALVRIGERSALRMVDLRGGDIRDMELPAPPTDVDLLPGSSFAIVSVRDREEIGILDLEAVRDGAINPLDWLAIEGQPAGQSVLSPVGNELLVFSAVADSERMSVVDLTSLEFETYNLRKGIRGAIVSPDGQTAIVYHSKAPGEPQAGEAEADIIAKSYAFTAFNLDTGISKLVLTDANPGEMTFDAGGEHAFILNADEATGVRNLEWIDLRSFRVDHREFDRTPEHVGVVPGAGLIYVSQIHDLGRIAFVDIETGEVREVTGFELNGLID